MAKYLFICEPFITVTNNTKVKAMEKIPGILSLDKKFLLLDDKNIFINSILRFFIKMLNKTN